MGGFIEVYGVRLAGYKAPPTARPSVNPCHSQSHTSCLVCGPSLLEMVTPPLPDTAYISASHSVPRLRYQASYLLSCLPSLTTALGTLHQLGLTGHRRVIYGSWKGQFPTTDNALTDWTLYIRSRGVNRLIWIFLIVFITASSFCKFLTFLKPHDTNQKNMQQKLSLLQAVERKPVGAAPGVEVSCLPVSYVHTNTTRWPEPCRRVPRQPCVSVH